jgi:hypothetical protein
VRRKDCVVLGLGEIFFEGFVPEFLGVASCLFYLGLCVELVLGEALFFLDWGPIVHDFTL